MSFRLFRFFRLAGLLELKLLGSRYTDDRDLDNRVINRR